MKKLSIAVSAIGFILFAVAGCISTEELFRQVLLGVVALLGLALVCAGVYMGEEWCFEEEDDFKIDDYIDVDDVYLSWIIYDSSGSERDMDIR